MLCFDDDPARYLEEMKKRAVILQNINRKLETVTMGEQQRAKSEDGMSEQQLWFNEQLDSLADKFKPFLQLGK
jgi:hypothetical protein